MDESARQAVPATVTSVPATARPAFARAGARVNVTLAAAGFATLAFASYPPGAGAAIAAFLAAVVVTVAAIDVRDLRIPNRVVLPATAIVLVADLAWFPGRMLEFVSAALLAGGVLLVPNLIRRSWMGMGDVKLGLLLGVALGWGVIGALLLAFMAVLPVALIILVRGSAPARRAALPFGPFMAFGALAVLVVPRFVGLTG